MDVLQPDITWLGGLTEARWAQAAPPPSPPHLPPFSCPSPPTLLLPLARRRIVAMAGAYDIPVIPHGSSVYSYHLQYAFNNCPVAEMINL